MDMNTRRQPRGGLWFFSVHKEVLLLSGVLVPVREMQPRAGPLTHALRLPAFFKNVQYVIHLFGLNFALVRHVLCKMHFSRHQPLNKTPRSPAPVLHIRSYTRRPAAPGSRRCRSRTEILLHCTGHRGQANGSVQNAL